MLQIKAVGRDVCIEQTIGEYECPKVRPSLFEADGVMLHSNTSMWLTTLLKETHVQLENNLSTSEKVTALVIDDMCFIQQHPFIEGKTFKEYQQRLLKTDH